VSIGGDAMTIPEGKDRIIITVPVELKSKLQKLADKDNRNLSNYVSTVLERFVYEDEKKELKK
jgi:hypothetical protein